ncbi:hypothetical protein GCM10009590_19460 [Brachybacterium alimentarium]
MLTTVTDARTARVFTNAGQRDIMSIALPMLIAFTVRDLLLLETAGNFCGVTMRRPLLAARMRSLR